VTVLKKKGFWRRYFGLKGGIHYYTAPKEQKPFVAWSLLPTVAATLVSLLSITVTSILAYRTLSLNQATFVLQHSPKVELRIDRWIGDGPPPRFAATLTNVGETDARNIAIYINAWSISGRKPIPQAFECNVPHLLASTSVFCPKEGSFIFPERPGSSYYVRVLANYSDVDGNLKPHLDECVMYQNDHAPAQPCEPGQDYIHPEWFGR
jgi:hypothetical protein